MRRYNQSTLKGVGADHPRKDFRGIEWMGDASLIRSEQPVRAAF